MFSMLGRCKKAGGLVELGRHRHLGEGASVREDGRETPVHLVYA
jgi:hypothetical protein